jgi:zinc D-Ala-D-Ala carboxypeptidase
VFTAKRTLHTAIAVAAALVIVGSTGSAALAASAKPAGGVTTAAVRDCIDVPNRDVGLGSNNTYVVEVQCLLNWAVNPFTYHIITVDGDFGSDTRGKVIKFQQCANALGAGLVVDGRVGPKTAPHLEWWAAHSAYIC